MKAEKIALLVDSTADLSKKQIGKRPIYTVPLRLVCGRREYLDGENITNEDVYRIQETGGLPKTSLPSMARVEETLDRIRQDGYRRVIALPLSSGLSGTYNMVRAACEERKDLETVCADTRSGALGIGMTALQLCEDIRTGMDWDTLTGERLPFLLQNTHPYFSVDTLEYLQKGGRIGKVTAMAGTLLSIKPILSFAGDGQLVSVAKVRGKKQVQSKLVELVKSHLDDPERPFDLAVENGGDKEGMEELRKELKKALPGCKNLWEAKMDATLATYVGKGMLGAAIQILE